MNNQSPPWHRRSKLKWQGLTEAPMAASVGPRLACHPYTQVLTINGARLTEEKAEDAGLVQGKFQDVRSCEDCGYSVCSCPPVQKWKPQVRYGRGGDIEMGGLEEGEEGVIGGQLGSMPAWATLVYETTDMVDPHLHGKPLVEADRVMAKARHLKRALQATMDATDAAMLQEDQEKRARLMNTVTACEYRLARAVSCHTPADQLEGYKDDLEDAQSSEAIHKREMEPGRIWKRWRRTLDG